MIQNEEIRYLTKHRGMIRAICLVALSGSDSSFYVFPYSKSGLYFFGERGLAEQAIADTFQIDAQLSSLELPKLSMHESGQVHIKGPGSTDIAGPLSIPRLTDLRGAHVCSVSVDNLDFLPEYSRAIKRDGPKIDRFVCVSDGVSSVRITFWVNGVEPTFKTNHKTSVINLPSGTGSTIYLGLLAIEQDALGTESEVKGISVIGGWDPTLPKDTAISYLYLRAQLTEI